MAWVLTYSFSSFSSSDLSRLVEWPCPERLGVAYGLSLAGTHTLSVTLCEKRILYCHSRCYCYATSHIPTIDITLISAM